VEDTASLKIVLVGDFAVGKTSLIRQLTQRQFSQQSGTTIGVEFKEHRFDNATLQLWDIAGQQYCSTMTKQYYRWAAAAIVVASIDKESTFDIALEWKKDVVEKTGGSIGSGHQPSKPRGDGKGVGSFSDSKSDTSSGGIPIYLFVNKADLMGSPSAMKEETIRKFAEQNGFERYILTSATDYESVYKAFKEVTDEVIMRQSMLQDSPQRTSTVNLNALRRSARPGQADASPKKSECCSK